MLDSDFLFYVFAAQKKLSTRRNKAHLRHEPAENITMKKNKVKRMRATANAQSKSEQCVDNQGKVHFHFKLRTEMTEEFRTSSR